MDASETVTRYLEHLVAQEGELGLQTAAYLDGELVVDAWAGLADEEQGRPVAGDTLFTSFSVSKGLVSTCIHILADRGTIAYDAPIAHYWPAFGQKGKETTTIRHALTHRMGLPHTPPGITVEVLSDWHAVCQAISEMEPQWPPGSHSAYHALTAPFALGEVIRRTDGRSIADFLQEEVGRPLGAQGLYFGVPPDVEPRVATLKNKQPDEMVLAGNAILRNPAAVFNRSEIRQAAVPGAGAIVNARSLARHYAALAGSGSLGRTQLLSPERMEQVVQTETDTPDPTLERVFDEKKTLVLGYMKSAGTGPMAHRPHAFGYEGLGTIGFADPLQRFAFAHLTNLVDWSPGVMDTAARVLHVVEEALGLSQP